MRKVFLNFLYCISTILVSTTVRYHSYVLGNSYLKNMENRDTLDSFINKRISYRMAKYQLSLSLKPSWNYTPSVYLEESAMFGVIAVTNLIKDKKDDILAFTTGRNGDTEGCPKTISIT